MPILRGLPIDEYHADPNYVSHSKLRDFAKGPRFFQERHLLGTIARKETRALTFGNGFECVWQRDGDAFDAEFAVSPQGHDGKTKAGKAWLSALGKKTHITHDDYCTMLTMVERGRECRIAMMRMEGCEQQVTLRGSAFGLAMQSRPDYLNLRGSMLTNYLPYTIDLKTTKDLDDLTVRDGITSLGYHTQAALARVLLKACMEEMGLEYRGSMHYVFAVSKEYPHPSQMIHVGERVLSWADKYLEKHCALLGECMANDEWPLALETICEARLPRWAEAGMPVALESEPDYAAEYG